MMRIPSGWVPLCACPTARCPNARCSASRGRKCCDEWSELRLGASFRHLGRGRVDGVRCCSRGAAVTTTTPPPTPPPALRRRSAKTSTALKSSISDLGDVDVVENGTSTLESAISAVENDAETLIAAAQDEFGSDVDDLQSSLEALVTSIRTIESSRRIGRHRRAARSRGLGQEPHRQDRRREVRLTWRCTRS